MIEAEHKRQVLGQPAQDHPGNVRAESDVRTGAVPKPDREDHPREEYGYENHRARKRSVSAVPADAGNLDIGTKALISQRRSEQ